MPNSDSLNKLTYVLNIFAVLTLAVLIGLYIGVGYVNFDPEVSGFLKSIISDIIAVLIIYLVISFFLDRKGLSPSHIFKDDLIAGIVRRHPGTKDFLTESEATAHFNIKDKLIDAKEIYMSGWTLKLVQKIKPNLIDALTTGTKIKLIITEPKSPTTKILLGLQNASGSRFKKIQYMKAKSLSFVQKVG